MRAMSEVERNRLITEAQAYEASATPPPWVADTATRGDCVVWGPAGQFISNAQAEPHWMPDPTGGKRAVQFDVDRRDAEFIAWVRNNLPLLVDELLHNSHTCAEFDAVEVDNAGLRDTIARVRQIATDETLQSDEGILIIDPSRITDIIDEGLADCDG